MPSSNAAEAKLEQLKRQVLDLGFVRVTAHII